MDSNKNYFSALLKLFIKYEQLDSINKQNSLWLKEYFNLKSYINKKDTSKLPEIMILIHPKFLIDNQGECIKDHVNFNQKSNFNSDISKSNKCRYDLINPNNESCIFNKYADIRGKCEADHFWPHSLGGPSIAGNRIILCKYHNCSKSNSIVDVFWNVYPSWLNSYLEKILNQKR